MSKLNWYINRLKSMSVKEIVWRVASLIRDVLDRYRILFGIFPGDNIVKSISSLHQFQPGFKAVKTQISDWSGNVAPEGTDQWRTALVQRAEKLCKHQLSYFDLVDVDHGTPIDWLKDHSSGTSSPLTYAQSIDYRDFHAVGDCKLVWEPNRHHHLVVLARTYVATADEYYAQEVVDQINSWVKQNPFGRGMNWRSPLELGVRLINWIWAFDLIRDSEAITQEFFNCFVYQVYLHCWDNVRKYSQGSSANNHLIGEVAGVYIAAAYFPEFPEANKWRAEAKAILENEMIAQSFSDGCTREHAFGYQVFVIQFFLYCGLAGREIGEEFSANYWKRLEKMLEFLGLLAEAGPIPMVGDADDGYVLDMAETGRDLKALFAVGAVLFKRSDFKLWSQGQTEAVFWLLGAEGCSHFQDMNVENMYYSLNSQKFEESGYYLLQTGHYAQSDRVSVFMDVAELGYGAIAAHGHADALSITLRVGGHDVLVDTGTYDYFTHPELRNYFRSTAAHNTVVVMEQNQSEMLGSFMWGKRAGATLNAMTAHEHGSEILAKHDGYSVAWPYGVMHERKIVLDEKMGNVKIIDELNGEGNFSADIYFHFSEECELTLLADNLVKITIHDGPTLEMQLNSSLTVELISGQNNPPGGWVSRGYHRKVSAVMVVAHASILGSEIICTDFTLN